MAICCCGFIDHADPKLVRDVESLTVAMDEICEIHQSLRRKKRAVDFSQIMHALLYGMNHAVGVHREWFHTDFKREPEHGNGLATTNVLPDAVVALHQAEEGTDDLAEHAGQVRPRIFGVMELGAEVGLPNAETLGDGGYGHPDIDAEARDVGIPDVLFKIAGREFAGKPKLSADRLAHGFPV